jgi:hypothetical protein
MSVQILVFCLDGADLRHLEVHAGPWPALRRALTYVAALPSTCIPQTPVAWTALLAGAGPQQTGVWGWREVVPGEGLRPWSPRALPPSVFDWQGVRVLIAGIPLVPPGEGPWGRALAGAGGPTKSAGGSRPRLPAGVDVAEAFVRWQEHHNRWCQQVTAASAGVEVALVHCDSVDWFGHRFGPSSAGGALGWTLAERLLAELTADLRPSATVVVSDHGAAPVDRVIRIHDALCAAGLMSRPGAGFASADELTHERVFCVSDYGALWCAHDEDVERARAVLQDLGAEKVEAVPRRIAGDPSLLPTFREGTLVLVPPELYPIMGSGSVVPAAAIESELAAHNWVGDHAPVGLLGTDDGGLWPFLAGATLVDLKRRLGDAMAVSSGNAAAVSS